MATIENTTVKIYKGVPLIKGGTEVLYLAQAAAESALSSFLFRTYTRFYYQRENRGYIQIDETIDELEGANYVSFVNSSHGTKIYFGFIDRLVYVNDNVTQVEYTIDPFPTYLGDTTERYPVFVVRNTYMNPQTDKNYTPDFLPADVKPRYGFLWRRRYSCNAGVCYFVSQHGLGAALNDLNGNPTGIQIAALTSAAIEAIQKDNGVIIGAYLVPDDLLTDYKISKGLTDATADPLNVFPDIVGAPVAKMKTGVYNNIVLKTTQGSKQYELEEFSNVNSIAFGFVGLLAPSPAVFVYPKNYKGVVENVAEGLIMQCPALPIATNATYTNQQAFNDLTGLIGAVGAGAISGFIGGGTAGALIGGGFNLLSGIASVAKNQINTKMQTPTIASNGIAVLTTDGKIEATLQVQTPNLESSLAISTYLDYYGYSVNAERNRVNMDDLDYLQTGSEFLYGSEADVELNARIMSGIKIRKTLT